MKSFLKKFLLPKLGAFIARKLGARGYSSRYRRYPTWGYAKQSKRFKRSKGW